jgi:hypothetical protein
LVVVLAGGLAAAPFAPPLLTVETPRGIETVGLGGVEVLVRFDAAGRAEPATFRVLLNGADVTDRLETAPNGAHGRLTGLLDGPNTIRLQVFGRGFWPPQMLVEETRELEILYRPPINIDRA